MIQIFLFFSFHLHIYSANYLNPKWIQLNESRGFESYDHKIFMRSTGKSIQDFVLEFISFFKIFSSSSQRFVNIFQRIILLLDDIVRFIS